MKASLFEFEARLKAFPLREYNPKWEIKSSYSYKDLLPMMWRTIVPGSGAPEYLMVEAVQSAFNMGKDAIYCENLLDEGFIALENNELDKLGEITENIFISLDNAPLLENHPYNSFYRPTDWYYIQMDFPSCFIREPDFSTLEELIYAGLLGQIIGASMGTRIEGYFPENLYRVFGEELGKYIGAPQTINDDITYELIFLEAFKEKGEKLTSEYLAKKWLEKIQFGWSAELIALFNLKKGLVPPQTALYRNPFQEWIGAQMRGMIEGLIFPGKPKKAAEFAFLDSQISHSGNGIYGGIHSAVLTSLSFIIKDTQELIKSSISYVPSGTEFKAILSETIVECRKHKHYKELVPFIMNRFKEYSWVHLYPNASIVLIALWYSKGNFDLGMEIVANLGFDVDCNAGEVGTILGVINGLSGISDYWVKPLNDTLETYIRGYEKLSIKSLAKEIFETSLQTFQGG